MYYQLIASFPNEHKTKNAYKAMALLKKSKTIDLKEVAIISNTKKQLKQTQKIFINIIPFSFGLLSFLIFASLQNYIDGIIIGLSMFLFSFVLFQFDGFDIAIENASLKLKSNQSGLLIWSHTQAIILTEYLTDYGGIIIEVVQRV